MTLQNFLEAAGSFVPRHIGPDDNDIIKMLKFLGLESLDSLIDKTVPANIRSKIALDLGDGLSERDVLSELKILADQNRVCKSYIGMGYSDCVIPSVIRRNILENPGWYTQYTPYQAEISQGRLQALLNFQTMISDLTGLPIANASLLDEGTAAAEAMSLSLGIKNIEPSEAVFFISNTCHPQTIEVVRTRALPLGIKIVVGNHAAFEFNEKVVGALVQYPATDGTIYNYRAFIEKAHAAGALVTVAADILSLTVLETPGAFGADIAVGSTQRFGVPLGYGGPHAAYFATKEIYKRQIPGRIVGVSVDARGKTALRLALQTREQHIRRGKATSNICTAQVLLGVIASMYAVYHGPEGLRKIAERIHTKAVLINRGLERLGFKVNLEPFFDTIKVDVSDKPLKAILSEAEEHRVNLRAIDANTLGIAVDETTLPSDIIDLLRVFSCGKPVNFTIETLAEGTDFAFPANLARKSSYLTHPVFNSYHSETEMLRYMTRLQSRDLSLNISMIPLGSCTMKLNATTEMLPITWPEFGKIHPFAPREQATGYKILIERLESMLAQITGFDAISLQPNAGSQGEYAGLLIIRKFHEKKGQGHRNVCLIPNSAHGTNPASAVMAGYNVVGVETDENGNISLADLRKKAEQNAGTLAALMVTYPSTHGVFEEGISEICDIIHRFGGQVYMDGANMNAQVGLCRPGDYGADVCHLNLHKTFCIPHGGGGPGVGPIGVKTHLEPFLPGHPVVPMSREDSIGPVSAAPWGSASILPISYAYIRMMGGQGLKLATQVAILNANYMARRLSAHFPVLFKGKNGFVAHECIIDLRPIKAKTGVEVVDVAKRLMDYGFHAPTISFPVPGTMMIEPTESESLGEIDRFCDAMTAIYSEILEIADGKTGKENNLLKNAPHTADILAAEEWNKPYSRERAVFPAPWTKEFKFWPSVARIDDPYGDRNLVCSCPPMESYASK